MLRLNQLYKQNIPEKIHQIHKCIMRSFAFIGHHYLEERNIEQPLAVLYGSGSLVKTGRGEPPCLLHARIILQVNKYTQSRCLEWGRQVRRLWTGTISQPVAALRISVGSDPNTPLAAGFISSTFTTSSSSPLQFVTSRTQQRCTTFVKLDFASKSPK